MQLNPRDSEEGVNFTEVLARGREMLIKRFWWFALAFVAVVGSTWLITKHQQRIYSAQGTLVIERAAPRVLSGVREVVNLGATGYWGSKQYYEAQRQIMQSREVAQMVVDRHGLANDPHLFRLDAPGIELSEEKKRDIMANGDPAGILAGRVIVSLNEGSMIARVSVRDPDPRYAQQLVNWLMAAYRDRNVYMRRQATREAYKELKTIAREMEKRKQASEAALLALETKFDLSDNHRKAVAAKILSLSDQLRTAEQQVLTAKQLTRKLRRYARQKDVFDVVDRAVFSGGLTSVIKARLIELSVKKRELEAVYLDKHPKVRTVDKQLALLRATARKHVKAMLVAAKTNLSAALETKSVLNKKLKSAYAEDTALRNATLRYEQLRAKRNEDRRFYAMVAKRQAETDLTNQVDVNNVSVLDEAVLPVAPVSPKKRLNYALGFILAIFAGLGTALAAELLDNTIKTRAHVETRLGIPFLGAIPRYQQGEDGTEVPVEHIDLYAHYRPKSRVAEASRSIRTNLLFMRPGDPLRSMVITSAHPREGKTSTSTTLAIAMANSSGSCVLVDTDLRKPRLHKVFGLSAESGVTSLILDPNAELTEVVQQTEVPGLHLLASGPLPPDSSRILHNERFKVLVEQLKAHYEVVIFDSPPVEIVSDAMVLSRLTDGVVLVAQAMSTRIPALTSTVRALRAVNSTILGAVLSRTQQPGTGYGYYYGRGNRGGRAYRYRYAAEAGDEDEPPVV